MKSKFQTLITNLVKFWFPNDEVLENKRPSWLNGLELDIFVPKYLFAVEVNGLQHYQPVFEGHSLEDQQERDKIKRRLCQERGILLHIVREFHVRHSPGREISRQLRSGVRKAMGVTLRRVPKPPPHLVCAIADHMQTLKRLAERNGNICNH